MSKYIVMWSSDGFPSEENIKEFDNYFQAEWFANSMKKWYDSVWLNEKRNFEEY